MADVYEIAVGNLEVYEDGGSGMIHMWHIDLIDAAEGEDRWVNGYFSGKQLGHGYGSWHRKPSTKSVVLDDGGANAVVATMDYQTWPLKPNVTGKIKFTKAKEGQKEWDYFVIRVV